MTTGARRGRVTSLIVAPVDIAGPPAGGIKSFVRGFIKYAPDDMSLACVAITQNGSATELARWEEMQLEGRTVRHLAIHRVRPLHRTPVPISLSFTNALWRYRRSLEREGDILQFHRPLTAFPLLRDKRPKVQVVHYEAAQMSSAASENQWRRVPTLLRWVEDVTVQRMSRVYAVNESTAKLLQARAPAMAARVRFLPNWVDDEFFYPAGSRRLAARSEVRLRFGWSEDAVIVLWVGRLEATKDPLLALEAYGTLQRDVESARLILAGDGMLREDVSAAVRDGRLADRVRLMGLLPPALVADLMRASDALLVSSVSEAGPTVALEALACGIPVVATAVGRIPALVSTGANGWVANARTPVALAEGLRWAVGASDGGREAKCVAAARPYHARTVLEPFYEAHFRLASRSDPRVGD